MNNFRIFTESTADVKFLRDYILNEFGIDLNNDDFDTLNGWSGYKAGGTLKASIRENNDNQKTTVLILDADTDFHVRQQEIINDFTGYQIPIKLFLMPSNNSNGVLESLLCEIAVERKIIECFESYQECINGYETPVIKSKIFAYLDALVPEKNKKNNKEDLLQGKNRDYRNGAHWNLKNSALDPLKNFLTPLLTP